MKFQNGVVPEIVGYEIKNVILEGIHLVEQLKMNTACTRKFLFNLKDRVNFIIHYKSTWKLSI